MSTLRVSASALERAFRCPGSFALPQANTTNEWAEAGTANHAASEEAVESGDPPEDVRRILGDAAHTARAEVMLVYDFASDRGRIVGQGTARSYGEIASTEIPGTADILAYDADRVYVIDRKLWQSAGAAAANAQLAHLAIAACRALGRTEATVALIYETGRIDRADLDMLDMSAHRARLRSVHASLAAQAERLARGAMPDVAEGSWCKYCPAAHVCPAKVALVRRLVSGAEADELSMLIPLDDETARIAYERLGYARNLLKRIEAAVYARAAESPIPLGDGKFLGQHQKVGNEKLDGDVTYEVIRATYGQAIADQAVERRATKSGIKAALKTAGAAPLSKAESAVLSAVRAAGGATRETSETIGEYIAAPQLVTSNNEAA